MANEERDRFDFGDIESLEPDGPPEVVGQSIGDNGPSICPVCGCKTMYKISIKLKGPMPNIAHKGLYISCPACPFYSEMMVVSEFKTNTTVQ